MRAPNIASLSGFPPEKKSGIRPEKASKPVLVTVIERRFTK